MPPGGRLFQGTLQFGDVFRRLELVVFSEVTEVGCLRNVEIRGPGPVVDDDGVDAVVGRG
jgi:hypothetical protein